MSSLGVLIFLAFVTNFVVCFQSELITDYLNKNSLKFASIFGCTSLKEMTSLSKVLFKQNIRNNIYNLNVYNVNISKVMETIYHVGIILDMSCDNSKDFIQSCGTMNFFSEKYHWLLLDSNNETNSTKTIEETNLNVNANIHLVKFNSEINALTIHDVYNQGKRKGGKFVQNYIGTWDLHNGYNLTLSKQAKYYARRDMSNIVFSIHQVLTKPFAGELMEYLRGEENTHIDSIERSHFILLDALRENYFKFDVTVKCSASAGYALPNGTYDGVVGALERSEVDLSGTAMLVKPERIVRLTYLAAPSNEFRQRIIFRHPKITSTKREPFIAPLDMKVWYCTLAILVLFLISFKVSSLFERKALDNVEAMSSGNILLISIASICQQGNEKLPQLSSSRVVIICYILFATILYQFYSASIVSSLLMTPPKTIKTIKDLIKSNLDIGAEDIAYNQKHFEATDYPLIKELYYNKILKNVSNRPPFLNWRAGIAEVKQGGYGFYVETATVYKDIEKTFPDKAKCDLSEITLFRDSPLVGTISRHSPFKEMFAHGLLRLLEHGVIYRTKKHWIAKKPECTIDISNTEFNLGLDECKDAIILLLFGICLSLIALIIEVIYYHFKHKILKKFRIKLEHNNTTFVW